MIFENAAELKDRVAELTKRKIYGAPQIFEDSSSYMAIYGGTILRLEGNDYFVMGDTREGRFGIDDQPKTWVKYAVDLTTGEKKIIKLVFYEQFETTIGLFKIRCMRSPQKEADFLELVRGDTRFMQGHAVVDPAGNLVRILDFVRGPTFFNRIAMLRIDHETYYHEVLPTVMVHLVDAIEAMAGVHERGQRHGDIRNDHLICADDTDRLVWIDFDYTVNYLDYDVWSMGNVINYAVGRGITTFRAIRNQPDRFPHAAPSLDEADASAFYPYRVANLAGVYPWIAPELNEILMRFSASSVDFYTDLRAQARDLRSVFGL